MVAGRRPGGSPLDANNANHYHFRDVARAVATSPAALRHASPAAPHCSRTAGRHRAQRRRPHYPPLARGAAQARSRRAARLPRRPTAAARRSAARRAASTTLAPRGARDACAAARVRAGPAAAAPPRRALGHRAPASSLDADYLRTTGARGAQAAARAADAAARRSTTRTQSIVAVLAAAAVGVGSRGSTRVDARAPPLTR